MTDPLPPWDESAERALLGSMLLSPDACTTALGIVAERDIYHPRHQDVFAAIVALVERGEPADTITVERELRDGGRLTGDGGPGLFLLRLTDAVPTSANVDRYADQVADAAERRRGIEAALELQQKLYAPGTDVAEVIRAAVERLGGVTAGRTGHRATMLPLADVQPERLTWLWPGRIPAGKLVVLDGDPSVGKSTVALDWAARISTGSPWPDGERCSRGAVVMMSAEDDPADTIRPRLDAAGGDPDRVHMLTSVRGVDDDGRVVERPPTLADVDAIREAIVSTGAVLLVVDVLMAYLPGKVDSHRDQDVRAVLSRLAALAAETGCTVLALRHMSKSRGGGVAMYAGGGSIGIIGAARAGYVAARDPDDPSRRVLAVVKANLGPEPESLAYRLVSAEGTDVARVEWLGTSELDAAGLLALGGSDEDRPERDEAVEWLQSYLADNGGSAPAAEVMKAARSDGIAERTLKRARHRAGVTSERSGFPARAMWSYDPAGPVGPQSGQLGQPSEPGPTGPTGGPTGELPLEDEEQMTLDDPPRSRP